MTLNVCVFFHIPASGIREMKGRVKVKVRQVIGLDLAVCVVEDVHWCQRTSHQNVSRRRPL